MTTRYFRIVSRCIETPHLPTPLTSKSTTPSLQEYQIKECMLLSSLVMAATANFTCNASLPPQNHVFDSAKSAKSSLRIVETLVKSGPILSISSSPIESLRRGDWVKLICGASFEDVVDVRNLSLVYALAGVDCIDCAAEVSVVCAVNEGIEAARGIVPVRRPWVMISVNDDEDLHFRKAEFDPEDCPPDCSRPCENVCPANAIGPSSHGLNASSETKVGVVTERCYGCGRCFPVCPFDKIRVVTHTRDAAATIVLLKRKDVDAVEIHTSGRNREVFEQLWNNLGDSIEDVKLVAVSLPNLGPSTISSMKEFYSIMNPRLRFYNLWQLDGRPMSGDIGRGATKETITFATQLTKSRDRPPGFLQLAGGTNIHTIDGLKRVGLFQTPPEDENSSGNTSTVKSLGLPALIGGVAYGGYARKIVGRILSKMETKHGIARIEDYPDYLVEAVNEAIQLVGSVKCYKI